MLKRNKHFLILSGLGVLVFAGMRWMSSRDPVASGNLGGNVSGNASVDETGDEGGRSPVALETEFASESSSAPHKKSLREQMEVNDSVSGSEGGESDLSESSVAAELMRLKTCWKLDSCGFPETDSRAGHFEAAERIKKSILDLQALKRKDADADLSEYAREWLRFPDDLVREAAMELLAMHPLAEENLQALVKGLGESHSAPLYARALSVLHRYQREGYQEKVNGFLVGALRDGGLFASEAVARNILPFLDHSNIGYFESAARRMVVDGRGRRYLEAAIAEFHLLQTGG